MCLHTLFHLPLTTILTVDTIIAAILQMKNRDRAASNLPTVSQIVSGTSNH